MLCNSDGARGQCQDQGHESAFRRTRPRAYLQEQLGLCHEDDSSRRARWHLQRLLSAGVQAVLEPLLTKQQWLRIAPHTIVTFIVFEQLRKLAGKCGWMEAAWFSAHAR